MKKIINLKPILAIVVIAIFAITFKSCKKADTEAAIAEKTELTRLDIIKKIKEQYGDVSRSVIIPINKNAEEIQYKDLTSKKMIKFLSTPSAAPSGGTLRPCTSCCYNCGNATSASQLNISSTLKSIQRTYYVQTNANGYKNDIIVNLELSLPFTPLNADPNNPANLSSGGILITPPVGPSQVNGNITPVAISFMGSDPACSANNLYKISFTWSWVINDINFTNGYQIDVALNLYNNCPLVGNFVSFGGLTSTLAGMMAPCDRTDNVWTNTGGPNNCIIAAANYITVTPPTGWATPDLQQLEYRAINNSSYVAWEAQNSPIYYGQVPFGTPGYTATFSSFSGFVELRNMIPGSGSWIVRFRNIKSPTCNLIGSNTVPPPGPYSPPYNGLNWPGNWAYRIFNL
jgi:hypothetical protein